MGVSGVTNSSSAVYYAIGHAGQKVGNASANTCTKKTTESKKSEISSQPTKTESTNNATRTVAKTIKEASSTSGQNGFQAGSVISTGVAVVAKSVAESVKETSSTSGQNGFQAGSVISTGVAVVAESVAESVKETSSTSEQKGTQAGGAIIAAATTVASGLAGMSNTNTGITNPAQGVGMLNPALRPGNTDDDVKNKNVSKTQEDNQNWLYVDYDSLNNTRDYISRLQKVVMADMDGSKQLAITMCKKNLTDAQDLLLHSKISGCEEIADGIEALKGIVTSFIDVGVECAKITTESVLSITESTLDLVGKAIDALYHKNRISTQQVVDDVNSGNIKLHSNKEKGNYGEMTADIIYAQKGYVRISVDRVMGLDDKIRQGIDGVYYNIDKQTGEPTFIIAESKYGTSQLSYTNDGKQMSDSWLYSKNRILNAVGPQFEKDLKRALLTGQCEKQLINIKPDGTYTIKKLE